MHASAVVFVILIVSMRPGQDCARFEQTLGGRQKGQVLRQVSRHTHTLSHLTQQLLS